MKLPTVIATAKAALANDMSVVLGLQTTGEASLSWNQERNPDLSEFVSLTASIASAFLDVHFPIHSHEPSPALSFNPINNPDGLKLACQNKWNPHHQCTYYCVARYGYMTPEQLSAQAKALVGEAAGDPKCIAMRDRLKSLIDEMQLPPSPLDELIDQLGGVDAVAEMTGRSVCSHQPLCPARISLIPHTAPSFTHAHSNPIVDSPCALRV